MKEDKPFNIFDGSAHHSPNVKKKDSPPKKVVYSSDENFKAAFKEMEAKTNKYRDELMEKLDDLQRVTGMSLKQMREFIGNSANFKPHEWEIIQKQRRVLEESLYSMMGGETFKKNLQNQEADKIGKERKGKTLGSRKKWIPIR